MPAAKDFCFRTASPTNFSRSPAAENLRSLQPVPGRIDGGFCSVLGVVGGAEVGGQYVDVSVQDAVLSVGAFALQRLGDGSLEHRSTRRFRYGGVFEAQGGFVELLTLEDRQWVALVELLGRPAMDSRRSAA